MGFLRAAFSPPYWRRLDAVAFVYYGDCLLTRPQRSKRELTIGAYPITHPVQESKALGN